MSEFLNRLSDALDNHDHGVHMPSQIHRTIIPAARLVRDSQTPDYEAAHIAYEDQYDAMSEDGIDIKAIVDAATGGGRIIEVSDE